MKKALLIALVYLFFQSIVLAADLPVTSNFGWRNDPITGEWKFHTGVDLGYDYGAGIPALFNGIVAAAGQDGGYGNCVVLYHSEIDAYTRYAHCDSLCVTVGQSVAAGEIIAYVGSTGRSTGPHLHLEYIVKANDGYQYINPLLLWQ